jgi:hypothetical protein
VPPSHHRATDKPTAPRALAAANAPCRRAVEGNAAVSEAIRKLRNPRLPPLTILPILSDNPRKCPIAEGDRRSSRHSPFPRLSGEMIWTSPALSL